jgi:aminoglycoside 3-N-acetyltransferase
MSIKQQTYHILRRFTSQDQRDRIKNRIFHLRRKASPLLKSWYGTYDSEELEAELRMNIPSDFEILMVHSSISNMKPMYLGTAKDVVDLLLRIVGAERTLAMPAFFFGTPELFDRAYYKQHPRFDYRRTPSQMGLVTELFRRQPGVVRSLHPTHSVCALGPLASKLCATHHLSPWACGELSPFGMMGVHKTIILGLGVEYYRYLTQLHAMEHILGDQYPIPKEQEDPVRVELVDKYGNVVDYDMCQPPSRDFVLRSERLGNFVQPGDIKEWCFRGTLMYRTEAAKIDTAVRSAALRGETLYVKAAVGRARNGKLP